MKSWVDTQPDAYLMCRDTGIRHSWDPYTAERVRGGYVERLKCDRCTAIKTRHLDSYGRPKKTSIDYPTGFLREGMGRMTRNDNAQIRVTHIKRRLAA